MITQNLKHRMTETIKHINGRLCPKCGIEMTQVEKIAEGDYVFIWYECSRDNCLEQWLEKKMLDSEKYSA